MTCGLYVPRLLRVILQCVGEWQVRRAAEALSAHAAGALSATHATTCCASCKAGGQVLCCRGGELAGCVGLLTG